MKKNILPFLAIAIVGIFAVIIVSFVGVGQRADMEAENNGEENVASDNNENGDVAEDDAEAIFKQTCASCHGDDLSGGMGPALDAIGGELSEDEIHDVIMNGKGQMPAGLATAEEADALAAWLSEME